MKTIIKDLESVNWSGPRAVAKEVSNLYSDKTIRILDGAAGTGLAGQELHSVGFENIDALDPVEIMLDKAKKRNVYKHFYAEYLGENELPIEADSYDVITLVGAFTEGHVEPNSLPELTRITKPGGYIVLTIRDSMLKKVDVLRDGLETTLNSLLENSLAKQLIKKRWDEGYADLPAPTGGDLGWIFMLQMAEH